jgi:hypothetical protein
LLGGWEVQESHVEWFGDGRRFMTGVNDKTKPIRVFVVSILLILIFGSVSALLATFQRKTRKRSAQCIPPSGWPTANSGRDAIWTSILCRPIATKMRN